MAGQTGVIYMITHRASITRYIGQTLYPNKRIASHLRGDRTSPYLGRAIDKYGKDAFVVEFLETEVPESLLDKMEILHIRWWNCKAPNGYNLTDGGGGSRNPSPETRARISKAKKGEKNSFYGKKHTPEALKAMSEVKKGKKASPETRGAMSEAHKGQTPWMKGKKHTPETRREMSEARVGEKNSMFGKRLKGEKNHFYGKKHSPESIKQMSVAQKGLRRSPSTEFKKGNIPHNKGKTPSPETRRLLREKNKGRKHSPETIAKMRESARRRHNRLG